MIALIDFDSILYKAVYKIVSIQEMKSAILKYGKDGAKEWLLEEVYNEGINRCENSLLKMMEYLEENFAHEIVSYELYLTTCKNSFRKSLTKTYKAKRKSNPYVSLIRNYYLDNGCIFSDVYEADDLIADRANELGVDNYIIISIDKDLKTIGGYLWSYYTQRTKDSQGMYVQLQNGNFETEYKQKFPEFITKKEADLFFWKQMLMGDATDGIIGIYGIGAKKADNLLKDKSNYFITVAREYLTKLSKEEFKNNYQLLKLGSR